MNKTERAIIKAYKTRRDFRRKDFLMLINIIRHGELTCELCGRPLGKSKDFRMSIDHIIPKSKGGSNFIENLQLAHSLCNTLKNNKIQTSKLCRFLSLFNIKFLYRFFKYHIVLEGVEIE